MNSSTDHYGLYGPPRRRGRCSGCLPFLAVISTTIAVLGLPLLVFGGLALFACWSLLPVLLLSAPLLLATGFGLFLMGLVAGSLVLLLAFFRPSLLRKLRRRCVAFALFLFPFHGVFALVAVTVWSFWIGLALGGCLFLRGEVFWDRKKPLRRWDALCRWFDGTATGSIFNYFPLRVVVTASPGRRQGRGQGREQGQGQGQAAGADGGAGGARNNGVGGSGVDVNSSAKVVDIDGNSSSYSGRNSNALHLEPFERPIFGYHPHGVYAFGLFSLVFQRSSGWATALGRTSPRGVLVGVASALLHIPLAGSFFSWFGLVPASREALDAACASADHDVALIPGKRSSVRPVCLRVCYMWSDRACVFASFYYCSTCDAFQSHILFPPLYILLLSSLFPRRYRGDVCVPGKRQRDAVPRPSPRLRPPCHRPWETARTGVRVWGKSHIHTIYIRQVQLCTCVWF
jgi:hypothetical protein